MKTRVIWGPEFVTEALFGIGLSFGLTSDMDRVRTLVYTPMYERLIYSFNLQATTNGFIQRLHTLHHAPQPFFQR